MAKDTKSRKRLGRGLSSLITSAEDTQSADTDTPEAPAQRATAASKKPRKVPTPQPPAPEAAEPDAPAGRPQEVPVGRIAPNPHQPRRDFDEEPLADLTASIRQQGVLQPLVVRRGADGNADYTLIAGERRLRAATQAGLETVPCIVRQATEQQMVEWALVENIQRTDLNPMEKARAYRAYIDRFSLSQAQAAQKLGQARATVANFLRLLELPNDVRDLIQQDLLSFGHAKILAGLSSPAQQKKLATRTVKQQLSVRKLEQLVQAAEQGDDPTATSDNTRQTKPAYVRDLEQRFRHAVGTRVSIKPGRSKQTGRIVIEYYSFDDFDRIAAALGVQAEG